MANPLKMLKLKPNGFQFIQDLPIDAPPKAVWKSLLNMGAWFRFGPDDRTKTRVEPFAGGRFYAEESDGSSRLHATITYIDPNKLLRMTGAMGLSHLPVMNAFIFELQERGKNGTLLRFCQRTFGYMDKDVQKRYAEGWKHLFPQLKALAEKKAKSSGRR